MNAKLTPAPAKANSTHFGCRSRPTGSSRRIRACWPRRGHALLDRRRPRGARWRRGPVVRERRPRPREITEAVARSSAPWNMRRRSRWAIPSPSNSRIGWREIAPPGMDRVFFTNSGSESVDTALKIAIAYHRARGAGQRTRSSAARRAITASASAACRSAAWSTTASSSRLDAAGVDHLPHTLDLGAQRLFARPAALGRASRQRPGAPHRAA
jgi:hypothetical protein